MMGIIARDTSKERHRDISFGIQSLFSSKKISTHEVKKMLVVLLKDQRVKLRLNPTTFLKGYHSIVGICEVQPPSIENIKMWERFVYFASHLGQDHHGMDRVPCMQGILGPPLFQVLSHRDGWDGHDSCCPKVF